MIFREIRKREGFNQQRLADSIGVKQSTVAMWETGKSVPTMKNLLALEKLLKTSVSDLCASFPKNAKGRDRTFEGH